jgi:hypothetical protein
MTGVDSRDRKLASLHPAHGGFGSSSHAVMVAMAISATNYASAMQAKNLHRDGRGKNRSYCNRCIKVLQIFIRDA